MSALTRVASPGCEETPRSYLAIFVTPSDLVMTGSNSSVMSTLAEWWCRRGLMVAGDLPALSLTVTSILKIESS